MDSIGNSLFERLFRKARKMGWHHAYGLLNEQGRMHIDIMEFANQEYYESLLQPLPGLKRQFAPMYLKNTPGQDMDLRARTIFINTTNSNLHEFKTNTAEAETCAKLVNALKAMYHESNKELHKESIGIITPFRAQSDLIYQSLCQNCADVSEQITVDTVERYQGSARDIIIISSCINQPEQLHLITSISSEGIDRKLNVATTRAREQLILLGNRRILELNPAYKKLIAWMEKP
jgi:DNA replication ATP-dependent helicase Dna2